MNNERASSMLPKNKTGIFASEIQKMALQSRSHKKLDISEPSKLNARLKMASMSNRLIETNSQNKSTAFKINVKRRKPLEEVNVKLMEAKNRPVSTKIVNETLSEEEDEPNYTERGPVRKKDEAFSDEYIQLKDSFKPSKKLSRGATPSAYSEGSRMSNTRMSIYDDRAMSSSFAKTRHSTAGLERKALYNEKSFTKGNNSRLDRSANGRNSSKPRVESTLEQDDDHLKDSSETTIFTSLNAPTKSETKSQISGLIYQLCVKQDFQHEFLKSLKSGTNSIKSGYFPVSSDVLNSPNSLANKRMQFYKTSNDSSQTIDKYRSMMENLDEEEFLKFLKVYRETKPIIPQQHAKASLASFKHEFKPPSSLNSEKTSVCDQENQRGVSPEPTETADLDMSPRAPMTAPEPPRFMNLQTQSLSLDNSYLAPAQSATKPPNFYVNYISNKLGDKHDSYPYLMNNLIADRSPKENLFANRNFTANSSYSRSNMKNQNIKFKSEQRFRPMKMLSFPAFA